MWGACNANFQKPQKHQKTVKKPQNSESQKIDKSIKNRISHMKADGLGLKQSKTAKNQPSAFISENEKNSQKVVQNTVL